MSSKAPYFCLSKTLTIWNKIADQKVYGRLLMSLNPLRIGLLTLEPDLLTSGNVDNHYRLF